MKPLFKKLKLLVLILTILSVNCLHSGDKTEILPAELVYFDCHFINQKVEVKWATVSEYNTKEFRVYRREKDDEEYKAIFSLDAADKNIGIIEYSGIDSSIEFNKIYFYKIELEDFDGTKSDYGNSIVQTTLSNIEVKNETNPIYYSNGTLFIDSEIVTLNQIKLSIYDLNGSLILNKTTDISEKIDLSKLKNLTQRVFFYVIESGSSFYKGKFIIDN